MKILAVVVGLTAPRTQEVLDRQLMIYVTAFGYVRISNKNTFIEMSRASETVVKPASPPLTAECYDELSILVKGDT